VGIPPITNRRELIEVECACSHRLERHSWREAEGGEKEGGFGGGGEGGQEKRRRT